MQSDSALGLAAAPEAANGEAVGLEAEVADGNGTCTTGVHLG
jgi:hypothetical protein